MEERAGGMVERSVKGSEAGRARVREGSMQWSERAVGGTMHFWKE